MEVNEESSNLNCDIFKQKEEVGVIGQPTVTPSSCDNADSAPTSGGNTNERVERKKKTRRGKPKGKNYKPYNKAPKNLEMKPKRSRQRCNSRLTYDQPEAPNNSNQFLIEDHNFHQIPDLSPKTGIMLQSNSNHRKCNRDSSFTSVESDEDNFYSSPEDEEEFLTKEFSETYKDLHEESLSNMSKNDLIRQILSLEEKIENLTKKRKPTDESGGEETQPQEKIEALESENNWLKREVERLNTENIVLRRKCRSSSESSIDSESDSSTSSSSSSSSSSNSKPVSPVPLQVNGVANHLEETSLSMEEDQENNKPTENTQNV